MLTHHLKDEVQSFKLLDFKANSGTSKGDNYMGDLASVEVKVQIGDEIKTFHWMVKLLKPDPTTGQYGQIHNNFKNFLIKIVFVTFCRLLQHFSKLKDNFW